MMPFEVVAYFPPLYQILTHLLQEELVGEYGHWEFDVATVEEVIGHLVAAPLPNFANWSRGYQQTEVI